MRLGDQVTSLELSQRLKELGVEQNSLLYWIENFCGIELCGSANLGIERSINPASYKGDYSAFTVAELGEMLPCKIKYIFDEQIAEADLEIKKLSAEWYANYKYDNYYSVCESYSENLANALAAIFIHLIENKLLKP